ncbi:protein ABIL3-like isoform X6 [Diospyros lotus]|uniref:protein ABIL3-like isoform X6 n=1 Tax=Diospyros lotus TaxID=55363 RepID=UPI00225A0C14|nr:protein ABIL3-like isoform X6 [Diospyros lotus]
MEMETETSCTQRAPQEASNYDELFMQNTLLFADSLKDLKNLRAQLYSAAEYFELAYCRDGQEQLVVETLKDYISKAIISTVDHLGSVACKVSNFLQEKIDEVSGAELRFFCMQQKLRTCQEYIHCSGLSEQSLVIKTPKFHKEYIVPVAGKKHVATGKTGSIYQCAEHDLQQSANGNGILDCLLWEWLLILAPLPLQGLRPTKKQGEEQFRHIVFCSGAQDLSVPIQSFQTPPTAVDSGGHRSPGDRLH